MVVRVIGGEWRGRAIHAPRDTGARPSTSRLREALFAAILPRVRGATVLDLFAGSGALGIEALSRGAAFVEFVEIDPRALRTIATNLESLGAESGRYRLRRADAWRLLDRLDEEARQGSILLMDPPYAEDLPARCLPVAVGAVESGRLAAFVLEHPADAPEPELTLPTGLDLRRRRHGQGAFTLLTRSEA
jgi:16S rRNA (guanine966-N2)-methyltransferase